MDVGLHVVRFDWTGGARSMAPTLAEIGTVAEQVGFSALSVMDHWFQVDAIADVTDPMLEAYATLGFLAAHTRTIRLRPLVSGVTYRHPGLLAKIVTTLDVVSGGRAQLGIGAAWYEREHVGLGVPYPPVAERFERLEETLQICLQMWSDDDGAYKGKHYQLTETICSPAPISQPHPPIVIGGNGERKTLRLVARYGDACNLMTASPDDVAHNFEVLRTHCDREQRDYDTIKKTIVAVNDPFADIDAFLADCERYVSVGVEELVLMADNEPLRYIERVAAKIIPRVG